MNAPALFADERPITEFSTCRTWRYVLRRRWSPAPALGFILLNPSTADETKDDNTIRRCCGYARDWGFGGIILGNLFAFRATLPDDMRAAADPIGPDNDSALLRIVGEVSDRRVICGWGAHGSFRDRGATVVQRLRAAGARVEALALTKNGEPRHPLYLRGNLVPFVLGA